MHKWYIYDKTCKGKIFVIGIKKCVFVVAAFNNECLWLIVILTKNTLGVKKVVAKNLKKAWMKKKNGRPRPV